MIASRPDPDAAPPEADPAKGSSISVISCALHGKFWRCFSSTDPIAICKFQKNKQFIYVFPKNEKKIALVLKYANSPSRKKDNQKKPTFFRERQMNMFSIQQNDFNAIRFANKNKTFA
jgi:hypothetical protein